MLTLQSSIITTHALWWSLLLFRLVFCDLVNVTIDDSDSSIVYLPSGEWNTRSAAAPCSACTANPDTNRVFNGTFHDGTFSPTSFPVPLTASVSFNGTAVYVICVLAESAVGPDGNSDMTFFIDGQQAGTFAKSPPGNRDTYDYNVPVFSVDSLASGQHSLTILIGHVNGLKSLILLDRIIYSVDDASMTLSSTSTLTPTPTSSALSSKPSDTSSKKNSSVVGPAVAVPIAVALLAALGICFFLRRRKEKRLERSYRRLTVPPPMAPTTWTSEPLSLPSNHPAWSNYLDSSGVPMNLSSNASSSQQNIQAGTSHLYSDPLPSPKQSNNTTSHPDHTARNPSLSTPGTQRSTMTHRSGPGPAISDLAMSSSSAQITRDDRDELASIPSEASDPGP